MRKYTLAVMTVVMVLALFWVALAAVTPTAQAGPLAAPTPAISGYSAKAPTELTWWDTTAVTADGKPSAHFEHSVVVREGGGEILSESKVNVWGRQLAS